MILFCITMLLLLSTVLILGFYVIARFAISEWKELFGKEEAEDDTFKIRCNFEDDFIC